MTILQRLKEAHLQARRERNNAASSLIGTVLGEAEQKKLTLDAELVQCVKKFCEGIKDTLQFAKQLDDVERVKNAENELALLETFLPIQMSEDALTKAIEQIMSDSHLPKDKKSMGPVMKALKEGHTGTYDGAAASRIFNQVISN
jgi:uncharacterized protein YqeY